MKKMMNEDRRLQRHSGIELLRIIAMLGVILLHINSPGVGKGLVFAKPDHINFYINYLVHSTMICGVDLFVLISGYFLSQNSKRRLSKVFELLLQCSILRVIIYFFKIYLWKTVTFSGIGLIKEIVPAHYFVILYLSLYLISPYINAALNSLTKEGKIRMIVITFSVFSVWSFGVDLLGECMQIQWTGLSSIGMLGSQSGFTITNFVLMYLVGAFFNICDLSKVKTVYLFMMQCFIIGILAVCAYLETMFGCSSHAIWFYNNPLIIIESGIFFILFSRMKFHNQWINELSKATFTCLLFHSMFISQLDISKWQMIHPAKMFLVEISIAIALYLCSFVIYFMYKILIISWTSVLFRKLDDYILWIK